MDPRMNKRRAPVAGADAASWDAHAERAAALRDRVAARQPQAPGIESPTAAARSGRRATSRDKT